MTALIWDADTERLYETGVSKGVLFPMLANGTYAKGVAWNGLTAVTESPSGAEATALYADNKKYLSLMSAEEFGATIEAYMYPDAFAMCDGSADLSPGALGVSSGVMLGQQTRQGFGLVYRTELGNDAEGTDYGYKLHLLYGAKAAPSERAFATVNDSPEAITLSWEVTTTPVAVPGFKPTALITIDSTKVAPAKMAIIEAALFGGTGVSPIGDSKLLLPDDIRDILTAVG